MKELNDHRCGDGLNELLLVRTADEPDSNGIHHAYQTFMKQHGLWEKAARVQFQKGAIEERGPNGISVEALLVIALAQLESFTKDDENVKAVGHLKKVMKELHKRTLRLAGKPLAEKGKK